MSDNREGVTPPPSSTRRPPAASHAPEAGSEGPPLPPALPRDLPRLQAIRRYLDQQIEHLDRSASAGQTVATYLLVQRQYLDAAIAAATPPPSPTARYRLQHLSGRAVLHLDGACPTTGGGTISLEEALEAIADPVIQPRLTLCEACRPLSTLPEAAEHSPNPARPSTPSERPPHDR